MDLGLYPGTFDPVTLGHVDIIERASRMLKQVVVGVSRHEDKTPLFGLEDRIRLVEASVAHLDNVEVLPFSGLLVEFARSIGAGVMVRGMRAVTDFDYEFQMAMMNRSMDESLETVFLMTHHKWIYLSSSLVREIASHGGDCAPYVPAPVQAALVERFGSAQP